MATGYRVHEISLELSRVTSAPIMSIDVMRFCERMGVNVRSASSLIEPILASVVIDLFLSSWNS